MPSIANMKMRVWIVVICATCIKPFHCGRMRRTTGESLQNHDNMSCDEKHRICTGMDSQCPLASKTETTTAPDNLRCLSADVFKGETAKIICYVNNENFNVIAISKGLDQSTKIATILGDGTVSQQSKMGKYEITYTKSPSLLTLGIKNFVCGDQDEYHFSWDDDDSLSHSFAAPHSVTTSYITMKAKPEVPTLTINPDLIENENDKKHICKGNVGNPSGYLQLEIRRPSSNTFTTYSSSDTCLQEKTRDCSTIHTLSFAIDPSENVNGSTFRCVSKNDKTTNKKDQVMSSLESKIGVTPRNLCSRGNGTYMDNLGRDCHKFVICATGKPSVFTCPSNSCFHLGQQFICDDCNTIPHCRNTGR